VINEVSRWSHTVHHKLLLGVRKSFYKH